MPSRIIVFLLSLGFLIAFSLRHEMSESWANLSAFLGLVNVGQQAILLIASGIAFLYLD